MERAAQVTLVVVKDGGTRGRGRAAGLPAGGECQARTQRASEKTGRQRASSWLRSLKRAALGQGVISARRTRLFQQMGARRPRRRFAAADQHD